MLLHSSKNRYAMDAHWSLGTTHIWVNILIKIKYVFLLTLSTCVVLAVSLCCESLENFSWDKCLKL